MKQSITLLIAMGLSMVANPLYSQIYQLNVQNGYTQSVQAAAGDTIHIWAEEWGVARTFSHWSGDTNFLERPKEWHTRVIMPAQNVTIVSNTKLLPTGLNYPLTEEQIMGRDRMKRVFSYFPSNAPALGVCWLWHGTGGSASTWAGTEYEQYQFVKYLIANGWGVIVTESDESTTNTDLNGDGALRYDYYPDSLLSVDIANVRAIRDTFIHRGKMGWDTPQAAAGFSAGGSFSTVLAAVLRWRAGITHCAPGVGLIIDQTQTPLLFSMNLFDSHPDVGAQGNLEAYENWQTLNNNGICSEFYLLRPSPAYPERYKRLPGISTSLSYSIHNELVANGCFGPGGYLTKSPGEIESAVIASPASWPVVLSLTMPQRQFVVDQLSDMWSSHHYHTDFMAADFAFISNPCSANSSISPEVANPSLQVYPNPTGGWINLPENIGPVRIFDLNGKLVLENPSPESGKLNVENLPNGLYFLQTERGWGRFVRQ